MSTLSLQERARDFRQLGKTYSEIRILLQTNIAKSTLSYWCKDIVLPEYYFLKIQRLNKASFAKAREISSRNREKKRSLLLKNIDAKNQPLQLSFNENVHARKIALAILYLAEGSKTSRGSLMFGNSDPAIVRMFVNKFRYIWHSS